MLRLEAYTAFTEGNIQRIYKMVSYDFEPDVIRHRSGEFIGEPHLDDKGLPMLDYDSSFAVLSELERVVRVWRPQPDTLIAEGFDVRTTPSHLEVVVFGAEQYYLNGETSLEGFMATLEIDDDNRYGIPESVISVLGLFGNYNELLVQQHENQAA